MTVLLILTFLYLSQSLFLFIGILKTKYKRCSQQPFVTVIVAARNEAENILNCLNSLLKLNYPRSKVEFLIVNDRSTDKTGEIVKKFITKHSDFNYINITKKHPFLSGKASAISEALQNSTGEIIFITDADCVVPQNWVMEKVSYFREQVGIVAGFTLPKSLKNRTSLFGKIQAIDWIYLLSIAAGAVGWKLPLSCIGNNFAFRRQAYNDVGGYERVGFSLTEDFALLQAVSKRTDWQIAFPINKSCLVLSEPIESIKAFFRQRKRWAFGGLKVRYYGKFIIGLGIFTHISILSSLLFTSQKLYLLSSIAIIIAADLILIIYSLNKLNMLSLVIYYPIFKMFYCFYILLLPLLILINKKVVWKDVTYTPN